jgi:hypothetical protein
LHENWALYQGTTLVVPNPIENNSGFSPCLSCAVPNFSASLFKRAAEKSKLFEGSGLQSGRNNG